MRASCFSLVGTLALSLLASCSDDTSSVKDTGPQAQDKGVVKDGSGLVTRGATLSLSCSDVPTCPSGPGTQQGSAAATQLDLCNYWDTTKKFHVKFIGGGDIIVDIEPFTGDGTYVTTADAKIDVVVGTVGTVPSGAFASALSPTEKCTIIAKSNLASIQIPAIGDARNLDISLDVTCSKLRAGGVCDTDCTVSPSTFQLSVKGCNVSK